MSRAYRVPMYEATAVVTGEDHLSMDLEMLDILAPEDMRALLRAELQADGWREAKGGGGIEIEVGGATARLDDGASKIIVERRDQRTVRARARDKGSAQQQVNAAKGQAEEDVQRRVVRELLGVEPQVRESVQQALQRTYIEALKQKAASMGEVAGILEQRGEQGELELTIKVKV